MIGKMSTIATALILAAALTGATAAQAGEKDGKPDPQQIARGAKAWAETCGRCHNLRDPKEYTDRSWSVIVNNMRIIGPLPGQVARDIKAFLQASN